MLTRRTLAIVIVLLAAAGASAALLKKPVPATNQATPASAVATLEFLPTDISQVQARDLRQTLPLSGTLKAVNQAAVKARVAGEIRTVLVREGEAVKAGQVLINMDTSEYQARLAQAQGALLANRGQLDIATKTRDNNKALLNQGFISKNAFDNAESQYSMAQANVTSARGVLDVAQKALSDTVIRAPIAGIVSSRTVQPGEKVSPDNRLLDIVDLGQIELEAAVPAMDIARVALGQEVRVRIEGLADTLAGKVSRINPATQSGTRSILVYIHVDNPQRVLRMGMFGDAQLTLAKKTGVLTVPQSAVVASAGGGSVYAIENGKLVQKNVTLGIKGDDGDGAAVEVISGLEHGAQIVKTNLGNLTPGSTVKLAKTAPVAAALTAKD